MRDDEQENPPEDITAEDYDNTAPMLDSGTLGLILLFPVIMAVDILVHLIAK